MFPSHYYYKVFPSNVKKNLSTGIGVLLDSPNSLLNLSSPVLILSYIFFFTRDPPNSFINSGLREIPPRLTLDLLVRSFRGTGIGSLLYSPKIFAQFMFPSHYYYRVADPSCHPQISLCATIQKKKQSPELATL